MEPSKNRERILARLSSVLSWIYRKLEFTCGDCDWLEGCGLPPRGDWVVRTAQLEPATGYGGPGQSTEPHDWVV